ncbi:hypothetical protein GCM10011352_13960 [Marinobacterium zhoushanense]|uniref:Transposase n=1 Tax=Marinobacterium zhoushanense TaxID=1679163 RepID=A0ABQ1K7K4_9GAMM|nr:hypothetical protein [Marinobacterium zhoushanense]GGB89187.1 hypothetical protein GCM10011352_13960 [Marinobacterium zhoushanense]
MARKKYQHYTEEFRREAVKRADQPGNNQSVANQLFRTRRDVDAPLRGELLEPAVAVTFDYKRYSAVISRIVQGLHWIEHGTALGDEIDVRVIQPKVWIESCFCL